MPKLFAVGAAALLLALAIPAVAGAGGVFVVGGGQTTPDNLGFGLSAHIGPDGMPFGELTAGLSIAPPFPKVAEFTSKITCLNVIGNRAMIGSVITQVNAPGGGGIPGFAPGMGLLSMAVDNGNPASGAPPDEFNGVAISPGPIPVCPPPFGEITPIAHGNILISSG
jgi:hypothetical protein